MSDSSRVGTTCITFGSHNDEVINVSNMVEQQALSATLLRLVVLSWMVTFLDGFDSTVLSFVAPYVSSDIGLSKVVLGNIFGVGLAGTMIGGICFGYLGDRLGRRPILIVTAVAFGMLTTAFALVHTVDQLFVLRFIIGIAVGGALPVAWALNIEFVPHDYRATVVTLVMLGYSFGAAAAGPMTVWLAPSHGWRAVFVAGGVTTLLFCIPLTLWLPESLRFLIEKQRPRKSIVRSFRLMFPAIVVTPGTSFAVNAGQNLAGKFQLGDLFRGNLRQITLWLWLAYIASSVAVFFLVSWSPIVLHGVGFTRSASELVTSLTAISGAIGGVALMRFTDRLGPASIAVMPAVAVPLLLVLGLAPLGLREFALLYVVLSFFLIGGHFGMHSVAGLYYPTQIRANGSGWAVSIAKIGSIVGPVLGGFWLSADLAARSLFYGLAAFPIIMVFAILALSWSTGRNIWFLDATAVEAGEKETRG